VSARVGNGKVGNVSAAGEGTPAWKAVLCCGGRQDPVMVPEWNGTQSQAPTRVNSVVGSPQKR